ncbi:MAG: hypothetical protein KGI58_01760 [Patescibacteria group bacterium]|nr:hypothetical protein [Patescibacteria group bacterium]
MSIHDLFYKIKKIIIKDNIAYIYIILITIIGFSSFLLGKLSVNNSHNINTKVDSIEIEQKLQNLSQNTDQSKSPIIKTSSNKYVASKNGKLYYSTICKSANRIKPENRVWFDVASDAEKSGYTLSSSC